MNVPLRILLTTIIILWQIPNLLAQQVWPGDINNNGIVNNIDVLYWSVANGATGDDRIDPSATWSGQDLPDTLWNQSFSNGLNYAYADCDGDGDVDDDDKTVIDNNFDLIHGVVTPDVFPDGNPITDPILLLSSDLAAAPPGGVLKTDLSLGTETDTISNFYGIAFTLLYDPDVVSDQGNSVTLDVLDDTWMNGMGDEKVIRFIKNDRVNGVVQIALVRKNQVMVGGFGDIGTFSIVMEDIVVGKSELTLSEIKMVDVTLTEDPVAPSKIEFKTDSTLTNTVQPIEHRGLRLYPNPVTGNELNIELKNQEEKIRVIQLFDMNGRLLQNRSIGGKQGTQQINIGQYPKGIYTVKIITDRRLYVQSFFR